MENPEQINYFAEADARNRRITFGIKAEDRTRHVYVIGKTGMGKSTLLENMAAQDVRNGNGFAFLDPHGSAIETILKYIPKERIDDVIYFAPFDIEYPISFNVMEDVGYDKRHLVVSGLMSTFKKIWQDAWSARMEYILGNTLLALLEYPNATLLEVNKMLSDKDFRKKVVDNITDPAVKSFWVDEFAKYTDRFAAEATPAIQNKIGQFTSNPLVRNIIGQPKSSFDLREVMDNRKILLVNLSKGRIGESNANLLGSMLITKLYLSALSRADIAKDDRDKMANFYLYVDEFQSFANDSFADILSEARKYKLNLTIAHQYVEQMTDQVRAAVFGNVGTMISFRVGSFDADMLEKEFAPVFTAEDIVNLGFAQIYLRLMIDGIGSKPFSARTLPPLEKPEIDFESEIIGASRRNYTTSRAEIEEVIKKLHQGNDKSAANNSSDNKKDKNHDNKKSGGRSSNQSGGNKNDFSPNKKNSRPAISKNTAESLKESLEKMKEKAFKEMTMPENSRDLETISLEDMTKNTQKGYPANKNSDFKQKKQIKTPESENKNSLRDALKDVLGEIKQNNNTTSESYKESKESPSEKYEATKKSVLQNRADSAPDNQSKQEIAEDDLRNMLEV